jgi:hypothetical protein
MKVLYHADAKRPRGPDEPFWEGEYPCAEYPTQGEGPLRLTNENKVTPPRLLRKQGADFGHLSSRTSPSAAFFAEYIVSEAGRISQVTVLRSVSNEFDALILAELESSVYKPATVNGRKVAVCMAFTATAPP